jgi:hypothetical protein
MKLFLYNVRKEKRSYGKGINVSFERILFFLFLITFSIMLLAQVIMIDPSARAFMIVGSEMEGLPLGEEEYLYTEGTIALILTSSDFQPDLKVLVNGIEAASFATQKVNIPVKDGDVVEIDGSALEDEQAVEVISQSKNITQKYIGKMVRTKSNVLKILKVKME